MTERPELRKSVIAQCPWCDSDRPLKKDGTFRQHYAYPWGGGYSSRRYLCQGSGMTPEAAADYAENGLLDG